MSASEGSALLEDGDGEDTEDMLGRYSTMKTAAPRLNTGFFCTLPRFARLVVSLVRGRSAPESHAFL